MGAESWELGVQGEAMQVKCSLGKFLGFPNHTGKCDNR